MATPDQMSFWDESLNKQIEGPRLFVNIAILAVAGRGASDRGIVVVIQASKLDSALEPSALAVPLFGQSLRNSSGSLAIFAAIRRAPQNRDDELLARFFSDSIKKSIEHCNQFR